MGDRLMDGDSDSFLYKKQVTRPGGGKRRGCRTLLSARIGNRSVIPLSHQIR